MQIDSLSEGVFYASLVFADGTSVVLALGCNCNCVADGDSTVVADEVFDVA